MERARTTILFVTIAGVSTAATALIYRPGADRARPAADPATRIERWYALPKVERLGHMVRYRMVTRRPDATAVFQHAHEFAALPVAEQDRLRLLCGVLQEVSERQPAARRRAMLALHQRARAEEVYRILKRESPERLVELHARLAASP